MNSVNPPVKFDGNYRHQVGRMKQQSLTHKTEAIKVDLTLSFYAYTR